MPEIKTGLKVRFYVAIDIDTADPAVDHLGKHNLEHAYRILQRQLTDVLAYETQDEFQVTHPTLGHSEGDPEELHRVIDHVTEVGMARYTDKPYRKPRT